MKLPWFVFMLVVLAPQGWTLSQDEEGQLSSGITSLVSIIQALQQPPQPSQDDLNELISTLRNNKLEAFNAVSPLMKYMSEKSSDADTELLRDQFATAFTQLSEVSEKYAEYIVEIFGGGDQNDYKNALAEQFQIFIGSVSSQAQIDAFNASCGSGADGVKGLNDALADTDSDPYILSVAVDHSLTDRLYVQNVSRAILAVVLEGLTLQLACHDRLQPDGNILISGLDTVINLMENQDKLVANTLWKERYLDDIYLFAENKEQMPYLNFSEALFTFLNSKYFWREWVVIGVENSTYQRKDIAVSVSFPEYDCYGIKKYRSERHLTVATVDKSESVDVSDEVEACESEDWAWSVLWGQPDDCCLKVALSDDYGPMAIFASSQAVYGYGPSTAYCGSYNRVSRTYNVLLYSQARKKTSILTTAIIAIISIGGSIVFFVAFGIFLKKLGLC